MRTFATVGFGVALTAALWSGGPLPVFADGLPASPGNACEPGPVYVPGKSLGPVQIGMPLHAVQRQLGRPHFAENRRLQGHQWTRMRFPALDVLARDNSVVAVNLPLVRPVLVRTKCGTLVSRPLSLPLNLVQQSYGRPSSSFELNGLQYLLYNALGLLFSWPAGTPYVQSLMVFPAGEYCGVSPVLVSFGAFVAQAVNVIPACARSARDLEP
jgi:hypothetical protein